MRNRTLVILALTLAWLAGCNRAPSPEAEGTAGEVVASSRQALTDSGAWAGDFTAIAGSGGTTFDCDSVVEPDIEEEPELPITIVPNADESFTVQMAGCQIRYAVAGSQATHSGQTVCAETQPDGYVLETTYRASTIQRRSDGTLLSRTVGDVAFGPFVCSFESTATYQRVITPG